MTEVPENARVGLWIEAEDEIHDLSDEESRQVLERHPALLLQYRKRRAMTGTAGRLIVIEPRLVASILRHLRKNGERT